MPEQAPVDHNKSPEAELTDQIYGTMRQIADTATLTGYNVTERVWEWAENPTRTKHIELGSYGEYPHVEISVKQSREGESLGEEPSVYVHLYRSALPDNDKNFDEHGEPLFEFDEDYDDNWPKDVDVLCTQYAVSKDDYDEGTDQADQDRIVLKFEEKLHFATDEGYYGDCDSTTLDEVDDLSIEELEKLNGIVTGLLQKVQAGPENK